MPTADEVIVEFEARVGGYEADLRRSAATFERVTQAQQRQMQALERQISASSGIIGNAFKGLAALFGAQQVMKLSDDYTRLQNSLKVAGLEGENLASVQRDLLNLGGEYGVSVNTLADLYGNLTQTGKELGATQAQILTINRAVAQSLVVTGKSSAEAQGAVLGLVQAFGNGKLQAEEYAQINEGGLRPLLEAAAASDKFGGSIQKLRAAVYAGKVTSQEFFQAILDGSQIIEGKAANATLTLEGAFTALNNRLIEFVGSAASTSGAAGALASGIQAFADNLDTASKALAVIATVVGVRYVAAAVAARVATFDLVAAEVRDTQAKAVLTTATYQANKALLGEASAAAIAAAEVTRLSVAQGVASRTASGLLAALGGPYGAAFLAAGAGIAVLASREAELDAASQQLSSSIEAQTAEFEQLRRKKAEVAAATGKVSDAQRSALVDTANLTGEAGKLADAWARVAAEAKNAALAQARARYLTAQGNLSDARARADRTSGENPVNILTGNNKLGPLDRIRGIINGIIDPSNKKLQAEDAKAQKEVNEAKQNLADAFSQFTKVTLQSLDEFKQDAPAATGSAGKKTKGTKKSSDAERASEQADRELSRLRMEELQARLDLATTTEARADIQNQILAEEKAQRIKEAKGNKDQIAAIERLYGASPSESGEITVSRGLLGRAVDRDRAAQIEREAQDLADEQFRAQQEILRNQYDLADSSADRKRLALASIDLEERYQRAQLEAIIASEAATEAEKERARIALGALGEISNGRRSIANRSNQSPLEAYRDKIDRNGGEINDQIESYVVDELQSVQDSIASGIQKKLGVKDPLLAGLINLFIEQNIIKPLANALAQSGSGGGGLGGLVAGITTFLRPSVSTPGRAIGGPVKAGVPYLVGENGGPQGRELFVPQQSGTIIPNHRLRGSSSAPVVNQTFVLDARGGITTPELLEYVNTTARRESSNAAGGAYVQSQQSAPGTLNKYNQLRG